jgi:hypothetical protein
MPLLKKIIKFSFSLFAFLFLIYLLLPPPAEIPPLKDSLKSTEPGDTIQIPGISAYYTNLSRQEVLNFYQKNFSKSRFLGIPLLTYRLNHPPEYAKQVIRDTQQSSYLEEIVHPLRESLFVNGYEWENDPFVPPESRAQYKMVIDGKEFKCKVTIRPFYSNFFFRILIFIGIVIAFFFLKKEVEEIYETVSNNRQLQHKKAS